MIVLVVVLVIDVMKLVIFGFMVFGMVVEYGVFKVIVSFVFFFVLMGMVIGLFLWGVIVDIYGCKVFILFCGLNFLVVRLFGCAMGEMVWLSCIVTGKQIGRAHV